MITGAYVKRLANIAERLLPTGDYHIDPDRTYEQRRHIELSESSALPGFVHEISYRCKRAQELEAVSEV